MGSEVTSKEQLSIGPMKSWKDKSNKEYMLIEGSANMLINALGEPDIEEDQMDNVTNQLDDLIIRSKKKNFPGVTQAEHLERLKSIFGKHWKQDKPGSRPAKEI